MPADCVGASRHIDGDGVRAAETHDSDLTARIVWRQARQDWREVKLSSFPRLAKPPVPKYRPKRRGALAHDAWNERFPR